MSKVYLKNLIHGKHPLASLLILELFYIIYTYLIADNISIAMGADGFLNDNIFVLSPLEIILSIFIVPPIEELISRIYLNKEFKYFNVSYIFLLFISFLFYFYSKLISILFFSAIIILLFMEFNKGYGFLKKIARINFIYFFLISSFFFAFVHIPVINSTYTELNFGTRLIVVTFSIFPFAIILGLVRYKYGLKYSILLHILNNGLILLLNSVIYS